MSDPFSQWSDADLVALIAQYPLAWVVSPGARMRASALPILLECDEGGRPATLLGHIGRSNPQFEAFTADPRAMFLFQGPHRYISPHMAGRDDWGPTWNYALARIEAQVTLDPALNDEALIRLVTAMERGARTPWTPDRLGDRYAQLSRHIVAFRATIDHIDARFKLGQDEGDDVFTAILGSLENEPAPQDALADWMRRMDRRQP